MSNEEFQKVVLERFDKLDNNLIDINTRLDSIDKKLNATHEQTTLLTEQITELKQDISTMDIITAKNNLEIAKLKAVK
jgi:chaperonin cofactor prefoldin